MIWWNDQDVWKILKFLKSFWILQSVNQSSSHQRFWICASCTLVSLGHSFSAEFLSQPGDSLPCFLSPAKSLEAFQLRCNARKKRGEIKDTQLFKLEPVSAMRLHLHRINNWQKSLQDVLWHLSSFTEHQEQNVFQSFWVKKSLRLNNSEIELMSNINGFM